MNEFVRQHEPRAYKDQKSFRPVDDCLAEEAFVYDKWSTKWLTAIFEQEILTMNASSINMNCASATNMPKVALLISELNVLYYQITISITTTRKTFINTSFFIFLVNERRNILFQLFRIIRPLQKMLSPFLSSLYYYYSINQLYD